MKNSKEYYDRIMSDYKSRGARRSLRKYCMDEGVDYQWLENQEKLHKKITENGRGRALEYA